MQKEIMLMGKIVTTEVTRVEEVTFPVYLQDTTNPDYPQPYHDPKTYTKITVEPNGTFKKVTIIKAVQEIEETEIQVTNWAIGISYSIEFPTAADQFDRCRNISPSAETDFDLFYKEAVHNLIVLNPVAIQTNLN